MFYGNHKVRKFYLRHYSRYSLGYFLGQVGLIFLSCSLLASCTNTPLMTQSSPLSPNPSGNISPSNVISGETNGTTIAPTPAPSPVVIPSPLTQLEPQPKIQTRQVLLITARVMIGNQVIDLEVANTPQEQEIGLMFRTELLPNRGMLFPFQPARSVSFWMKNTLIPLDMVFLHQGIVQYVASQVPPCVADPCPSYGPPFNVDIDQVIELRNGRAAELDIKTGDRLTIEFLP